MHRWLRFGLVGAVGGALAIQLVPYGRAHADGREAPVPWPSPEAEALFDGACADCHTEQTSWPWYSNVAPMSWLVQRDVDRGRDAWNLSEELDDLDDGAEELLDGSMPPRQYELAHPDARLSDEEQALLVVAFEELAARYDDQGGGDNSGPGNAEDP